MLRKLLILSLFAFLIPSLRSQAATYAVKAGGGGDYSTIQSCVNAMAAGDTCVVYAGTYNEVVSVSAGTAGNYKTVTVNGSDVVYVYGFTVGSHTRVIGNCAAPATGGSCGFTITRPSSPASNSCVGMSAGTTDVYIKNNLMTQCGNGGYMFTEGESTTGSTYIYIQGNTFSYGCDTPSAPNTCKGLQITGSYQLIENNDISHVADGSTNYANHTIYRGNTFHDLYTSECGSHSSNCHIDIIESEPVVGSTPASAYNLYEGNIALRNIGNNDHGFLLQADACSGQCTHAVIRYNVLAHIGNNTNGDGGTGILADNAFSSSTGYQYIKSYNNTNAYLQDPSNQATDFFSYNSSYGGEKNNIFYAIGSVSGYDDWADYNGGQTGFTSGGNLSFCTGSCSWASDYTATSTNKTGNPLFVNAGGDDFHLQSGSPAVGGGTYLTTATNSGSASTSLVVSDASWFYPGYGFVSGDWVRVGSSATAQITSIDYSSNTLTLASSISWSSGAGVYLYKDSRGNVVLNGTNPDVGALPSGTSGAPPPPPPTAPNPPTNLTATVD